MILQKRRFVLLVEAKLLSICCLLSCLVFDFATANFSFSSLFPSACAEPLQAGVTQTETIGPVAPPLQAGATFDERNLPPLHTRTGWYMIPTWYAGLWHREFQVDKVGLLRTVKHTSRRDRLRGDQVDRLGRIWQAHDEPNVVVVDTGKAIDYILDRATDPISMTSDQITVRYIGSDILVDKGSRRIIKSGQRQEVQELHPGPGGILVCKTKLTRFDQNGNQIGTIEGSWTEQLIKPFQPLDFYQGRNYFQDFCQYLQASGQANAIPQRTPAYSQQPPAYSQQPPIYSQQPPAYSQQPPTYSQQPPAYSQQPPAYSQQPPAYSQPPQAYSQPPPAYRQPPPVYSQPAPTYTQPPPAYNQPPIPYSQPAPSYSQPPH